MLRYICIIFTLLVSINLVLFSTNVLAGSYTDSAHGSNLYGVDRTATANLDYARGNCAHCHEMHASIGGVEPEPASGAPSAFALFANNFNTLKIFHPYIQSDDFCFYCHTSVDSLQVGGIINKDYSATFAGAPETVTSIFDQFNELSYHNLYDIYRFAQTTFPSFFTSYSNPCIACHNPHLAKRDKTNVTNPAYSAVSLPTKHDILWINSTRTYTVYYQAPFYYHSTTTYEPGGSLTTDGSNIVDWNTFCTRCHNTNNVIYSSTLGRNLRKIDWTTPITVNPTTGAESGGDKHGIGNATGNITMTLLPPYSTYLITHGYTSGITLSCLDCHEPHGSPNIMLLRRVINGNDTWDDTYNIGTIINVTTYDSTQWVAICDRCHISNEYEIHHGGLANYDYPYVAKRCTWCHGSPWPINCTHCHFHGGDDSWLLTRGITPTYRKCF